MSVHPYDENKIQADDLIIRRINPVQHVIWDDNRQRNRISKKAYSKSTGEHEGMSVDIEALILADSVDPKEWVTTPIFTASVSFTASSIRDLGLWIGYEEIKDLPGIPDNPYHGEVWKQQPAKRFSGSEQKGLLSAAEWYVELPDVDLR